MQIRMALILTIILLVVGLKAQEVASLNSEKIMLYAIVAAEDECVPELAKEEAHSFTLYGANKEKLSLPMRESMKNNWGVEIARYYALFESVYVYEEQPVEGDPNVVVRIRKPRIYKSIKGIESYLRKELRKENCSLENAREQIEQILKIGIAAISEDSDWFEKELKTIKDKKEQIALYNKIVLKTI